jgi:ribosomal 30S subunit maturation factor RimM
MGWREIVRVEGETKTRWIIRCTHYRKDTGREVGGRERIYLPEEGEIQEIREEKERKSLIPILQKAILTLPLETLRLMQSLLP